MIKTIAIAAFLLICVFIPCDSICQSTNSHTDIETITTDLNKDGKPDTIILSNPTYGDDPGVFKTITVKLVGFGQKKFNSQDVWDNVDTSFLAKNHNAVNSKRIFVFTDNSCSIILLFGFIYGSGRDEFSVIQIKNNNVKMLFDDRLEIPIKLSDFNKDGQTELLGRNYTEVIDEIDSLQAEVTPYNPYYIYSFKNDWHIDEALTKKYNEENYVWAGLKYNEGTKVLCPKKGKARIIK